MIERNKLYLPELDGLRAFAVTLVIINHFNKDFLPSGFLGVDIFFLISGFVITSSLIGRHENNFWRFISNFYARRIKRILPALVTCLIISGIVLCFFNDWPLYEIKSALTSVFGLSNIYFIKISMDYFSQTAELNPFMHTWSLGVEEQFYFLFPLIFWFSGFGSTKKFSEKRLFIRIGILAVVSLLGFISLYQKSQAFTYFFMPTRFWEIAAGCLLFLSLKKKNYFIQRLQKIPPLSIIFLMILVTLLPLKFFVFSVCSIILLTSILIITTKKGTFSYLVFTNKKVVFIGLISYSLYLWHWPVIAISRLTIGIQWWTIPFQIILIFFLAILTYYLVENPIRKNKSTFAEKKNVFIAGTSSLVLTAIFLSFLYKYNRFFYIGNKELIKERNLFRVKINSVEISSNECSWNEVFEGERPQCTVPPLKKDNPIMHLFGDSHSQHYLPLYEEVAKVYGYGYKFYGRGGIPLGQRKKIGNKSFIDDSQKNFLIDETIKKLSKNDIIVISERHERNFAPKMIDEENLELELIYYEGDEVISRSKAVNRYGEYLKSLFKKINKKGAHLVIFQPTHSFKGITLPPNVCRQWFTSLNPECEKGLIINREIALNNLLEVRRMHLRIAEETDQGIKIFDPFSILCPPNQINCTQILDKKPLYADGDHLSEEGALIMKNKFLKFLNEL